jgi:hypothetical protein
MDVYVDIIKDTEPGTWISNGNSISGGGLTLLDCFYECNTYFYLLLVEIGQVWMLDIDYDSYYVDYKCIDDTSSGQYTGMNALH